jgi:acetate kinase
VAGGGARRIVTCHLGAGSSLAAIVDGKCVDTTMGFTPNEGIPMATRSGSVDVGMLTWLLGAGITVAELDDGLQHRSGLAGLAGTGDMREVIERAAGGNGDARLALDVWLHRLAQAIGAMAVSAGGLDLLVFTGRIGEGAASLRRATAERLSWLGVTVHPGANEIVGAADAIVSEPGARPVVAVVHAREDLEIARAARHEIAT